jgi:hypothetical protein
MNIDYLLYLDQYQYCRPLQAVSLLPPAEGLKRPFSFSVNGGLRFASSPHALSPSLEFIVRICFDPSTLHQSRSGSVTGVVYFELDPERQFPGPGWSDFVVVLASWWMVALKKIADGTSEVELRFMDGPYWITVASQEGALLLRCMEDNQDARVVYELRVKLNDLTGEIFSFARKLSDACKAAGIRSVDLDNMRTSLPN